MSPRSRVEVAGHCAVSKLIWTVSMVLVREMKHPRSKRPSGATSHHIPHVSGSTLFYALLVLLIASQQAAVPATVYEQPPAATLLYVGLALFIMGELGNLYHHRLLARICRSMQLLPAKLSLSPLPAVFATL